ncbi:MAG: alr0857 family protein [Leptolyngbyaceae cyanobacterium]
MLKATYTETGLCLEYCPEPLSLLLSDRVCTSARAQRPIMVQPIEASIPLAAAFIGPHVGEKLRALQLTRCDGDWFEITLSGLWLSESPDQDEGIFMTELDPRLEQRLLCLWQRSLRAQYEGAICSCP